MKRLTRLGWKHAAAVAAVGCVVAVLEWQLDGAAVAIRGVRAVLLFGLVTAAMLLGLGRMLVDDVREERAYEFGRLKVYGGVFALLLLGTVVLERAHVL